ncbi:MAG TPA: PIN domain-containing protein [Candidatus Kapabacteria bacterium]|jgi:hypothetical protein
MNAVFADTFYFLGLWNRRDQYANHVRAFSAEFRGQIITTDWVLIEVADALASSEVRDRTRDYFFILRNSPSVKVIEASCELFDRGLNFFHRHNDKEWTLTDCTSFIVMRDLGIKEALTGDKHFEQARLVALLK